ncbi:hypothetical protein C8R44DRAFT_799604 [Mycena epipterygia]|nr:hypothetical protein C8R44DRAFT_799604 [Mycena epipterygia]
MLRGHRKSLRTSTCRKPREASSLSCQTRSNFFISAGGLFSSTGTIATSAYAVASVLTFASAGFITVPFDLREGIDGSDNRHLLFSDSYYVIFHFLPLVAPASVFPFRL